MSSSESTSSSAPVAADGLMYSPLSGQAVNLGHQQFSDAVLYPGLDARDLSALIPAALPLYDDFKRMLANGTSEIQQAALVLLNNLSKQYHEHFYLADYDRCLHFVDVSQTGLSEHPTDSLAKCQLVAVSRSVVGSWTKARETDSKYTSIAFQHVVAGVFANNEDVLGDSSMGFVWSLLKARPDLVGTVLLSMTHESCEFVYADRASAYTSSHVDWDKSTIRTLVGFIHRLYNPFTDPTITLERRPQPVRPIKRNIRYPSRPLHAREPVWLIRDEWDNEYRVTNVLAVGEPLHNGNWVGAATQRRIIGSQPSGYEACPRVVIKDTWSTMAKEKQAEDVVLKHVHGLGRMAGVCTLIGSFVVPIGGDTLQVDARLPVKHKRRLILDGTSRDVYCCTSVVQFLMVAYDLIEVLKTMHQHRGILYRDVSLGNIRWRAEPEQEEACVQTDARFIGDVVAHRYSDSRMRTGPTCTVIDFDHAFSASHMDAQRLKCAAGTPPFVARAVVQEFEWQDPSPPPAFPVLYGSVKKAYVEAHGQTAYDSRCVSRPPPDSTHRPIPPKYRISRPVHDAESCFWYIVYFLATAMPRVPSGADDTTVGDYVCRTMEATQFHEDDKRATLFEQDNVWTECLHPDLQDFGDLLEALAEQVRPSYEAWGDVEDEYHLHRAMQMILMQEICRILDEGLDVPLDTEYRRKAGTEGPFRETEAPRGTKRRGESLVVPDAQRRRIASEEA